MFKFALFSVILGAIFAALQLTSRLGLTRKRGKRKAVGFFHPYCHAGGGGERVLWEAIHSLQVHQEDFEIIIYASKINHDQIPDDQLPAVILEKVQNRFGIELSGENISFVWLKWSGLLEASSWPAFTMVGQSLSSCVVAFSGLMRGPTPDIYIDTMGYGFIYPLIKLFGMPVISYTHFPTISSDMIRRVKNREAGYTNGSAVSKNRFLSRGKLFYYEVFKCAYSICLRRADIIMVNSTWTLDHISDLLTPGQRKPRAINSNTIGVPSDLRISSISVPDTSEGVKQEKIRAPENKNLKLLYPPCDTKTLSDLPLDNREQLILSVGQFRPEKNHETQIEAFSKFIQANPQYTEGTRSAILIVAGSCRDEGDHRRADNIENMVKDLGIQNHVQILRDVSFPELVKLFGRASVGLHTMIDEHFGISVVDFMSAGLIPLVHASGGPLLDIVTPIQSTVSPDVHLRTGFHAVTSTDFALQMELIFGMSEEERTGIRKAAREKAKLFGQDVFNKAWMACWEEIVRNFR